MGFIGFILSLVFAALGLGIAVIVGWQILGPLIRLVRNRGAAPTLSGSTPTRKPKSSRLKKVDALIEKGRFQDALKRLRKQFKIKSPRDAASIQSYKEFNQNILTRSLLIAEELGVRPEDIAEVEHSLLARVELLHLLLKANESYRNIRSKREKAGKELPSWSRSDFDSRIKEIKSELEANEKQLSEEMNNLFDSIESGKSTDKDSIVYH